MKIIVLYAYYEKDVSYKTNLVYFCKYGIIPGIDYLIICNGPCTVSIPDTIPVIKRENTGFDFGAWTVGLDSLKIDYDYYFFINSSVRGPFLPNFYKDNWTVPFLELLSLTTLMAGISINMMPSKDADVYPSLFKEYKNVYSHVQSMFFVLSKLGLDIVRKDIFTNNKHEKLLDVVHHKEVRLSQLLLNKGYNINCILPKYKNLDYRIINYNINKSADQGDPWYPNKFFYSNIHPCDAIFIKTNRIPLPALFEHFLITVNDIFFISKEVPAINTEKTFVLFDTSFIFDQELIGMPLIRAIKKEENIFERMEEQYPGFGNIWNIVLRLAGYEVIDINSPNIDFFKKRGLLMHVEEYKKYYLFFEKCVNIAETSLYLKLYPIIVEKIYEYLPCFYFYKNNISIQYLL